MKNMMRLMVVIVGFILYGTFAQHPANAQKPLDWPMFGQNIGNTASNASDISAKNVNKLRQKWTFTTGGDISARAAVVNGVAYFPDWQGNLYAVNASNGKLIWSHMLSDYEWAPGENLAAGTVSRTSPAVADGFVYIGTQGASSGPTGLLLKIKATTGELIWAIQPDTSNPFPVITASPVVANGTVYVGMTSNEEFATGLVPGYQCCSARGSVVAVSAADGSLQWQTFTVPPGYSGGAVWGSTPVVDVPRGTVFVGTGNNYSHPTAQAYLDCMALSGKTEADCLSPDNHVDSILALDVNNKGHIKWAHRFMNWDAPYVPGSDDWNVACVANPTPVPPGNPPLPPPGPDCPSNTATQPTGPDFDFGSAPNEITYQTSTGPKTIIGAGQKSGIYYALDPDTGALLWQTQVGPGSSLGGIEWGSATDGTRIYVAIANLYGIAYPAGSAGSWAALDPKDGTILWQMADPSGAIDIGPVTVANGVVYVGSMGGPSSTTAPTFLALDAANGKFLWNFPAGSSVNAGASIVKDTLYWGSGYSHLGSFLGTGNNKFYAFTLSGS
jgi:polyvinyl alcohol dehydrogenase (cytochrome)